MIKITKSEKDKLLKMGCTFGYDIQKTYSGHPSYYLIESKSNIKKLGEIRTINGGD